MSSYKEYYEKRRAAGICVRCLKNPSRKGFTQCEECAKRQREYQRVHYRETHVKSGRIGHPTAYYVVRCNGIGIFTGTKKGVAEFFGVSINTVTSWRTQKVFRRVFTIERAI